VTTKKISLGPKPITKPTSPEADEWVKNRDFVFIEKESNKRLTIDVPDSLHRAIKMQCAGRGTKIADEVRELLLQKYGNTETIK
jgi:hypothetical protein